MIKRRIAKDLWGTLVVLLQLTGSGIGKLGLGFAMLAQATVAKDKEAQLGDLLAALESGSPVEQRDAAHRLAYPPFRGHPIAFSALLAHLDQAGDEVLPYVMHALTLQGHSGAVEPLHRAMSDSQSEDVVIASSFALARFQDHRAVPVLIEKVANLSLAERATALSLLGNLANPLAIDAIVERLKQDESGHIRAIAASVLGRFSERGAAEALLSVLGDESAEVRRMAARSLGDQKNSSALSALEGLKEDPHWQVQTAATLAICQIIGANQSGQEVEKFRHHCPLKSEIKD